MLIACVRCNLSDRAPRLMKCGRDCQMKVLPFWEKTIGEQFVVDINGNLTTGHVKVPERMICN